MLLNILLIYVINIVGIVRIVLVPVTSTSASATLPEITQDTLRLNLNSKCSTSSTYPLFPGEDAWAGDGLHGALGFELSPLLFVKAPIRFGLEPGLGRHCGLR